MLMASHPLPDHWEDIDIGIPSFRNATCQDKRRNGLIRRPAQSIVGSIRRHWKVLCGEGWQEKRDEKGPATSSPLLPPLFPILC